MNVADLSLRNVKHPVAGLNPTGAKIEIFSGGIESLVETAKHPERCRWNGEIVGSEEVGALRIVIEAMPHVSDQQVGGGGIRIVGQTMKDFPAEGAFGEFGVCGGEGAEPIAFGFAVISGEDNQLAACAGYPGIAGSAATAVGHSDKGERDVWWTAKGGRVERGLAAVIDNYNLVLIGGEIDSGDPRYRFANSIRTLKGRNDDRDHGRLPRRRLSSQSAR